MPTLQSSSCGSAVEALDREGRGPKLRAWDRGVEVITESGREDIVTATVTEGDTVREERETLGRSSPVEDLRDRAPEGLTETRQDIVMEERARVGQTFLQLAAGRCLSVLQLAHCGLRDCRGLEELQGVMQLDLSHNLLASLPGKLLTAHSLRDLDLSHNEIRELPPWIGQLVRCSRLSLAGNPLGEHPAFPPDMGRICRRMKYLQLGDTGLTSVPSPLLALKDLRHLDLSNMEEPHSTSRGLPQLRPWWHRNLLTLPSISTLQGLVKLEVVGTSLSFLPPLASLVSLRILDVARNCLSSLPSLPHSLLLLCVERNSLLLLPSLSHLTSLRHLLASHNQICDLGPLPCSLVTLDLYSNQLPFLPQVHPHLPCLVRVDMGSNPLLHFEDSLAGRLRGWAGVEEELEMEQYRVRVEGWQDRGNECAGYGELQEEVVEVESPVSLEEEKSPEETLVEDFYRISWMNGEQQEVQEFQEDEGLEKEDVENGEEKDDWGEDAELFSTTFSTALK